VYAHGGADELRALALPDLERVAADLEHPVYHPRDADQEGLYRLLIAQALAMYE
jgi:hypothetical protein